MARFGIWIMGIAVPSLFVWLLVVLAPARHNPFAGLDLTAAPGLGTHAQILTIRKDRDACFAALEAANVLYYPLEEGEVSSGKCSIPDGLTLDRSLTPYSATLRMTCGQTAALYAWERHIARPAAVDLLGSPIARIETYGSFACRNVAGTTRLSQHGHGNAVDISGFRLEDGRLIDVKTHWKAGGPEAKFLKAVHGGACDIFSVTLGPEYNAAHADHFHLDMGPGRVCR